MIKKKAKKTGTTVGKKTAKKSVSKKKQQMDPAKVREEIAGLVKAGASEIAEAVIDQAAHGELAPTKYPFEMAGIFPKPVEGEEASEEEDCLAKTLLARLDASKKASDEKSEGVAEVTKENKPSSGTVVEPVVV